MRFRQIIEASIPFGKLGDTTGMTFGFESELVVRQSAFSYEIEIDDEEDLIYQLQIDQDEYDRAFQAWLDDDNEGDYQDWIKDVGLERWLDDLTINRWEYGVVDGALVRYDSWENVVNGFAEHMKDDLHIDDIVTAWQPEHKLVHKNYSDWHIEGDGSITGNDENDHGIEVVSPVFHSYDEFAKKLSEYLKWIETFWNGEVYTNRTTGLHINIGMANAQTKIDPLKLLLFSGEKWVANLWRQNNTEYTDALLPKLNAAGIPRNTKDASEYVKTFIGDLNEKSFAINFLTLLERGYVEFRPIGNMGYETRIPDVLNHISRFIQLIQIASTPDMYQQEYAKKLGMLIGGGKADPIINMPSHIRAIHAWLSTLNLNPGDRLKVLDNNYNLVITPDTLIRFAGFLTKPFPPQIIKLLIKYGNITPETYRAAWDVLDQQRWIISGEYSEKAHATLDPYFT